MGFRLIETKQMWWIVVIIIVFVFRNKISWSNRTNTRSSRTRYGNDNYSNRIKSNSGNLNHLDLSELFDEYSQWSKTPPPDSLVRRAYERGQIFSGRSNFTSLNEEDKKTILRIAISIWNKRKKDHANALKIDDRQIRRWR